jgi:hypothetical protein
MNIAIFASAFHPSLGGVEEVCRQLALEYQRRGMGVIVLTNRWPRGLPAFESIEGIDVHRLVMRVPTSSAKSKISYALTGASVRWAMLGILRKFQAICCMCILRGARSLCCRRGMSRLGL